MVKSNGRMLSDQTLNLYAEQILECIKMWEVGQTDAYYLVRQMLHSVKTAKTWVNPLQGTGFSAPKIIDELAVKQGLAPTVPTNAPNAPTVKAMLDAQKKPN